MGRAGSTRLSPAAARRVQQSHRMLTERTIQNSFGQTCRLSAEAYVLCCSEQQVREYTLTAYLGRRLRLISDPYDRRRAPGHHFNRQWRTVCPEKTEDGLARYIGVPKGWLVLAPD